MTAYQNAVYDRTAQDITDMTSKAYLNVADWARIYNNALLCHNLVEFLLEVSISFTAIAPPTAASFPGIADLNTLCENIENIRTGANLPATSGMAVAHDWMEGASAPSPTYADVNLWEQVIDIIFHGVVYQVSFATIHCGVCHAGQESYYQSRWRQWAWVQPDATPVRHARSGVAVTGAAIMRQNSFRVYPE